MFTFSTSSFHYNWIKGQKTAKFQIKIFAYNLFISIYHICLAFYGLGIASVFFVIHIPTGTILESIYILVCISVY